VAKTNHSPKARSLTAVHAAWCIGPRRVAIACAEDSRPAACCIVDALVARGYDAELQTGSDARSALRRDDDPGRLRVLWLPDHGDRPTKDKLRRALDPQGAGDVLVLASPTPRGVIEAIEAFASGKERPRARSGPRRTYLEHPTRCEATVDVRGFMGATLGAAAATAAVLLAVRFGSEMMMPSASSQDVQAIPAAHPITPIAPRPLRRPVMDPTVLGATVLPLEDPIDEVGEPSTTVRVRVRERAAAVPARFELPIDEAPLETTAIAEPRARVELTPTSSPAIERSQLATIDPFGD
jgi:hypothetical protein